MQYAIIMWIAMICAYIMAMIFVLLAYIVHSLFLYTLASKREIDKKFLAWIPVIQDFYMCKIVDVVKRQHDASSTSISLFVVGIITSVFGQMFDINWLTAVGFIMLIVAKFMLYEKIFSVYSYDMRGILAFLCVINPTVTIVEAVYIIRGWKLDPDGYSEPPVYEKPEYTKDEMKTDNPYQE